MWLSLIFCEGAKKLESVIENEKKVNSAKGCEKAKNLDKKCTRGLDIENSPKIFNMCTRELKNLCLDL